MCGRVLVKGTIADLLRRFAWAKSGEVRALGQHLPALQRRPASNSRSSCWTSWSRGQCTVSARWGLIPRGEKDPKVGRRPISARSETVASNYLFRNAYRSKRALMPIDGFFEWKDIFGDGKKKQPYAVARKDGQPFALAAVYDDWPDPVTGEEIRTFCVLTTEANAVMSKIHDRMPVTLHDRDYMRWLGPEDDPRYLLVPFPPDLMTMWPIGSKVGSPKNDMADILDPIEAEPQAPPPPHRPDQPGRF